MIDNKRPKEEIQTQEERMKGLDVPITVNKGEDDE